jgi:hypothetical protein
MRRVLRTVTTVAALAIAMLATTPADATDGRRPGFRHPAPSVFPQPRDPWRSWGVRRDIPKRVGAPHHHGPSQPSTVWIAGHWAWDGATWVWWPGHWGVR